MSEHEYSGTFQVRCQACGACYGEFPIDTPHLNETVLTALEQHVITAHGWTPADVAARRDDTYLAIGTRIRAAWRQQRPLGRARRVQSVAVRRT
jgi:hypothetical protein